VGRLAIANDNCSEGNGITRALYDLLRADRRFVLAEADVDIAAAPLWVSKELPATEPPWKAYLN
jgi:hypothetical protein